MNSHTTARFRAAFRLLPVQIRDQAREAYRLFKQDPYHGSLRFKQINASKGIYSVRITRSYRAVGVWQNDDIYWFWIGTHADYDKLISQF